MFTVNIFKILSENCSRHAVVLVCNQSNDQLFSNCISKKNSILPFLLAKHCLKDSLPKNTVYAVSIWSAEKHNTFWVSLVFRNLKLKFSVHDHSNNKHAKSAPI